MTGAGIGVDYSSIRAEGKPIRKTGGVATGPIALAQMLNECGRGIMQGGSRRSAIWAGLSWKHADIHKFITLKNWSPEVRKLKEKDFNFPATMDGTNISVQLDDDFFLAYKDEKHPLHNSAHQVYWATVKQMLKTAEPGFSVDVGKNKNETLRNAPVSANTYVLLNTGYTKIGDIVDKEVVIWTGKQWAPTIFKKTKENTPVVRVSMTGGRNIVCDPEHEFITETNERIKASNLKEGVPLLVSLPKNLEIIQTNIKVLSVENAGNEDVFCCDVKFEEHSFMAEGVIISNCTEVTSSDDSDICNLGSINLARISSLEDMKRTVELGTAFLLAGTVYSDVPYAQVDQVRTKNRRLGLGLMGIHEWLLLHGKKYGPDTDLEAYLKEYEKSTQYAHSYADKWEISKSVKTRAIAPVGSIGIIGETTTGIEPIFCAAFKRRYLKGNVWTYQYVLDPTAKKLVDKGVSPDNIEDAYSLAENVERRVEFQAWVQQYVDHGISSTINLPAWGSELNNENTVQSFGNMLMKHLPNLRGLTCYPDGARSGQPITSVKYSTAEKHVGEIFVESADVCDITRGGSCGA